MNARHAALAALCMLRQIMFRYARSLNPRVLADRRRSTVSVVVGAMSQRDGEGGRGVPRGPFVRARSHPERSARKAAPHA